MMAEGTLSSGVGPKPMVVTIGPSERDRNPVRWAARRRRLELLLPWAVPTAVFAGWEILARTEVVDRRFFPPPSTIASHAATLIANGIFLTDAEATVFRVVSGFLIGAAIGVMVGLLMGGIQAARMAFTSSLAALYTVPKISILPLLLLIFGLSETPKVILVAFSTMLLVSINTLDAVVNVPYKYIEAGRAFGASGFTLFREIVVPAALPHIFTGLRLGAGMAVLVVVGTEFVAANTGLGYLIWNSWGIFDPASMFVGIVAAACLGVIANQLIGLAERWLVRWKSEEDKERAVV
jgi:ABC-type nitrate/sulfonate/bicarbonate transport system permease component